MNTPYIYEDAGLAALNTLKANITKVYLVKDLGSTNDFSTITGSLAIANDMITAGDMSIQDVDGLSNLVIAGKNDLTKTGKSDKWHTGNASAGTPNTITEAGAGWVVDTYIRKVVHIASGTGIGQSAKVISNTSDTLTFEANAFQISPDDSSVFELYDDLSVVYTNGTKVLLAVDESTDKAVSAAVEDTVSIGAANVPVPIVQNKEV
jgi:hypothetical protein